MRSLDARTLAALLTGLSLVPAAIGAEGVGSSHCTAQEEVFFSCQVGKKIVSLCALRQDGEVTKLSYRYGVPRKIENEYIANMQNQHRFFASVVPLGPQATINQAWFVTGDTKYLLTECVGAACPHASGLTVFRRERMLSNARCAQGGDGQPWFSSGVVKFGPEVDASKSTTRLLLLMEVDNSLDMIYAPQERGGR